MTCKYNPEKEGKSDRIATRERVISTFVLKGTVGAEKRRGRKRLMIEESKLGIKAVGKSTVPARLSSYIQYLYVYPYTYVLIYTYTYIINL